MQFINCPSSYLQNLYSQLWWLSAHSQPVTSISVCQWAVGAATGFSGRPVIDTSLVGVCNTNTSILRVSETSDKALLGAVRAEIPTVPGAAARPQMASRSTAL